jgi:hypothetical protein
VTEQAIDLYKHFYPLSRIHADLPTDTAEEKKSEEKSTSHPFNDQDNLDRAAEQFAERIMGKKIKVSIATIQGFLLSYKKDAVMALDKVDEWAEGIRKEQNPNAENEVAKHDAEGKGSEKEEIVEKGAVEIGEKKVKVHEVEKQDSETQEIIVENPEKQESVQEVVLA